MKYQALCVHSFIQGSSIYAQLAAGSVPLRTSSRYKSCASSPCVLEASILLLRVFSKLAYISVGSLRMEFNTYSRFDLDRMYQSQIIVVWYDAYDRNFTRVRTYRCTVWLLSSFRYLMLSTARGNSYNQRYTILWSLASADEITHFGLSSRVCARLLDSVACNIHRNLTNLPGT